MGGLAATLTVVFILPAALACGPAAARSAEETAI